MIGYLISKDARKRFKFSNKSIYPSSSIDLQSPANLLNTARELTAQNIEVDVPNLWATSILFEWQRILIFEFKEKKIITDASFEEAQRLIEQSNYSAVFSALNKDFTVGDIKTRLDLKNRNYNFTENQIILVNLILLWLTRINPALSKISVLFNSDKLAQTYHLDDVIKLIKDCFKGNDKKNTATHTTSDLFSELEKPILKNPNSLLEQIKFYQENSFMKNSSLSRLTLQAIEEMKNRTKDFHIGVEEAPLPVYYDGPTRFSDDSEWMNNLILIAKNIFVWLSQLSKKYNSDIRRLDQIPDQELNFIAESGVTSLWLIGIWERSDASQTIKRWCGNADAEASAYSLKRYEVAEELGGQEAFNQLKERCTQRNIRMATDMVPNHTAIDSDWMLNHPDWFIQMDSPPFGAYTFSGESLCHENNTGIFLEDHYFDNSDAAVVFKYSKDGKERFIFHGNDGTSMPWNDTAQLNFLLEEVRSAVIDEILKMAEMSPVIRFDAAMTLTKKHFRRLWYPDIDSENSDIASRNWYGLSQKDFDELMPKEFWSEVVKTVEEKAPNTLLLAEAFWFTESFFVEKLGMHRVYNSSFMHMLRDEDNEKYRTFILKTLEHNPEVLKRYTNFMNNPDEASAASQFGTDGKYFGICTLLVTLPGLPMIGHGQIQGLHEKYGMDFRNPRLDENDNEAIIARHRQIIFPLTQKRYLFSAIDNFMFYNFNLDNDETNHNVFAYSNGVGSEHTLIIYNNCSQETRGFLHRAANLNCQISKSLNLLDDTYYILEDLNSDSYLIYANDVMRAGVGFKLQAYSCLSFIKIIAQPREENSLLSKIYNAHRDGIYVEKFNSLEQELASCRQELKIAGLKRIAGVAISLFSLKSKHSVGCGEFLDLIPLIDWSKRAGMGLLYLLPVNDTGLKSSPYSVESAFALNPIFISLREIDGYQKLEKEIMSAAQQLEQKGRLDYEKVYLYKDEVLQKIYKNKLEKIINSKELNNWLNSNSWCISFAVFKIIKRLFPETSWRQWSNIKLTDYDFTFTSSQLKALKNILKLPSHENIKLFFEQFKEKVFFFIFVQFELEKQFVAVKEHAEKNNIILKGDLPILMQDDSIAPWLEPNLFITHLHAGAPADIFSKNGQNWGFPVYNWPEHMRDNLQWWRSRLSQAAKFYHSFRIDHVLGFFRIWGISVNHSTGRLGRYFPLLAITKASLLEAGLQEEQINYFSKPQFHFDEFITAGEDEISLLFKKKILIREKNLVSFNTESEKDIADLKIADDLKDFLLDKFSNRVFLKLEDENEFAPVDSYKIKPIFIEQEEKVKKIIVNIIKSHCQMNDNMHQHQGRELLGILSNTEKMIVFGEDLGVVPDYVAPTLDDLDIFSLKVTRWCRYHEKENSPFMSLDSYPSKSMATSSVHDSSTLRGWYEEDKESCMQFMQFNNINFDSHSKKLSAESCYEIVKSIFHSTSQVCIIPIQDLMAIAQELHLTNAKDERINTPGTISSKNWTYRLPLLLDELLSNKKWLTQISVLLNDTNRINR